jgi:hypothetical protein
MEAVARFGGEASAFWISGDALFLSFPLSLGRWRDGGMEGWREWCWID